MNRSPVQRRSLACCLAALLCCLALHAAAPAVDKDNAEKEGYLGPLALCASRDGRLLYVACLDAKALLRVELPEGKVAARLELPAEPTSMALSPDGKTLYVACAAPKSTVAAIDLAAWKIVQAIPAGHTAMASAVSPDGKQLFVCNRFDNNVSRIDLAAGKEIARLPVTREPVAAAITPDGKTLVVANHLPNDKADAFPIAALVSILDLATGKTDTVQLPDGSHSVRGLCLSPDGAKVYVTHLTSNYNLLPTQVDMGWMSSNCVTLIDLPRKKCVKTVGLDENYRGVGNPWGVAMTADGATLCVTHAGTHELSVVKTSAIPENTVRMATSPFVDSFMALPYGEAKIWRIGLAGNGPRAVAVIGKKAYTAEYFSDTLTAVDLEAGPEAKPQAIALGPAPKLSLRRRGEMLFNDASFCFQQWQSCASCHPDARADVLNWDLMNDGVGNPKNTKSLLLCFDTPPSMAEGVRENAAAAVRAGMDNILFAVRPEEDVLAIDEYLRKLQPVPSPHLVNGQLSPAAQRGKAIFESERVTCAVCHPPPLYTDLKMHDVGTRGLRDLSSRFDTPTLVEIWRTAPYLHDGRYATLGDLLIDGKHGMPRGSRSLGAEETADLIEYILSL